jgi:major capsid protein E
MEDLALTFPYTATDLTNQINLISNRYGLMQELDLFPTEGSTSTIVEMSYENKTLRALPARERDASSTPMLSETGKTIFMEIPHFPAQGLITPKDLQDILVVAGRTKRHITLEEEVATLSDSTAPSWRFITADRDPPYELSIRMRWCGIA